MQHFIIPLPHIYTLSFALPYTCRCLLYIKHDRVPWWQPMYVVYRHKPCNFQFKQRMNSAVWFVFSTHSWVFFLRRPTQRSTLVATSKACLLPLNRSATLASNPLWSLAPFSLSCFFLFQRVPFYNQQTLLSTEREGVRDGKQWHYEQGINMDGHL